jgi:hypothetical protein
MGGSIKFKLLNNNKKYGGLGVSHRAGFPASGIYDTSFYLSYPPQSQAVRMNRQIKAHRATQRHSPTSNANGISKTSN